MTKGGEMAEPCEPPPEPTSSLSTPPAASHNPFVLTAHPLFRQPALPRSLVLPTLVVPRRWWKKL